MKVRTISASLPITAFALPSDRMCTIERVEDRLDAGGGRPHYGVVADIVKDGLGVA